MKKLFNHILVPVNFNRDTPMVVEKAIAVANGFQCDIHLLYINSPLFVNLLQHDGYAGGSMPGNSKPGAAKKMATLLEQYRCWMNDGLSMDSTITTGNWLSLVKQFIITHHVDLVIIPGRTKRFLGELVYSINVNRLTRETNCPVLTVTRNMEISHLKNIVVPVNGFLPIRKLTAATYIATRFNSIIHLMGYKKNFHAKESGETKWVSRAYQLLRDHTPLKIYHSSVYGNSAAGNTLSYARQVEADLIVVNSGEESIPGGWINHLFRRYLYERSNIPVLTIAPRQQFAS